MRTTRLDLHQKGCIISMNAKMRKPVQSSRTGDPMTDLLLAVRDRAMRDRGIVITRGNGRQEHVRSRNPHIRQDAHEFLTSAVYVHHIVPFILHHAEHTEDCNYPSK